MYEKESFLATVFLSLVSQDSINFCVAWQMSLWNGSWEIKQNRREMNGRGSRSFRVWMRVVWVGKLRCYTPSVCMCKTPNLSIHQHNWPNENMPQIVFPLWPLVMNRRFQRLNWFVLSLSPFHPGSGFKSPTCIYDLFYSLQAIVVVTAAAISLFKTKDIEIGSCRKHSQGHP